MNEKIERFLEGVNATLDATRKISQLFEPELAFNFNMLNFFLPGENKTTEIIAFFLDPKNSHGQQTTFLKEFISLVKLESTLLTQKVSVFTERRIDDGRRIDLVLEFGKRDFCIAIENKYWAEDQLNQIRDYHGYLKRNYNKFLLIYLTPWGKYPDNSSIDKETFSKLEGDGELLRLAYDDDIILLLQKWEQLCKAEKVRYFLKEFRIYIEHKINEETMLGEHDSIIEYIFSGENQPTKISTALAVIDAGSELKNRIINELMKQVSDLGVKKGLTIGYNAISINEKESGFSFTYNRLSEHGIHICFEFEDKGLIGLYYGLARPNPNTSISEYFLNNYKAALREKLKAIDKQQNENWIYWEHDNNLFRGERADLIDIINGNKISKIEKKLDVILEALKEVGLPNN